MPVKQTRKSSREIKDKILNSLKESPLSTKQLSELLGSNWSTINNCLNELKKEGYVKEIYSRENLKIYVRSDYPVFYGIPLDKKKLNDSVFLLSEVIKKWQEKHKQTISKTAMQKIAVEVIVKNNLAIPIVRFHYGKVLTAYLEPEKYQETMKVYEIKEPYNSDIIVKAVKKEIEQGNHSNIAWKEKKRQYETHEDMKIFKLGDDLNYTLSKKDVNIKKINELFTEIFLKIPTSEEYSYLFNKYDDFLDAVTYIFNSKEFNESEENRQQFLMEILNIFNSLWQALNTTFFFNDIQKFICKDYQEIFYSIKDSKITPIYLEVDEKLKVFSEYKKSLTLNEIKLSALGQKIYNILLEGADEE